MAKLTALNGQTITARSKDGKIFLEDSQGNMSQIVATDVEQKLNKLRSRL